MTTPFKSLPTFDSLCERLADAEKCIAAQGEIILELLQAMQEREYEITFLMNISTVVIPTSKIADANGKVPAIRKSAKQLYEEEGRAKVAAAFAARAKAEQDAKNLSSARDASQKPSNSPEDGTATDSPIEFTIPGRTTH